MAADPAPTLKRSVSLPMLALYGLGTIVGGGFYALVGKVSGDAGLHAPVSMLLAALLATLTGLSYAELSSRYPTSAGTPQYVYEAWGNATLSIVVGWLVVATGIVSAATLTVAFVGFLSDLVASPRIPGLILTTAVLTAIAAKGITESLLVAVAITLLEVGGLVYVFIAAAGALPASGVDFADLLPAFAIEPWAGIGLGAFLIFYAFIGFEDVVTLAEETHDPERTMPRALVIALVLTALLYTAVSVAAVMVVPQAALIEANTPLALLIGDGRPAAVVAITVIGMFAGVNGALVQFVMAARISYGMAREGRAPHWLGSINARTRTPLNATVLAGAVSLLLALTLPLLTLAKVTSGIILFVFVLVNAALVRIRRTQPTRAAGLLVVPLWVPWAGALSCVALLAMQAWRTLA